ncbi:hypothetical protein [Streptomyces sp. NPDC001978]|uniref:hypothetical protein n=1 Tax=Streptomyces sp. NPDC001978 TaxID=3364627 RepID=UPI0036B27DF8
MSTLTALATLRAEQLGRAQPLTTVRHTHIAERPFVLIPLKLAGEACAPLAAMAGTDRDQPQLLVVPQPRNRTQRFRFTEQLAALLMPYFDSCRERTESYPAARGKETRERYAEAPQILLPNPGGVAFIRLLGRSTRLRRTTGEHAVDPAVPLLGNWLTWACDQSEFPGSSLLLSMTGLLTAHWATGQSSTEDGNLAAVLGWIDPPAGLTGPEAALLTEDPDRHPSAGPATDPVFDRTLVELIATYDAACATGDEHRQASAVRALETELRSQLLSTWHDMWHGIGLLRELPPGRSVSDRWAYDRTVFTLRSEYIAAGGAPQPRRDHAAGAARRLARLEEAVTRYQTARAFDDPLVMAEYELDGAAFAGRVVARDAERMVQGPKRAVFRPLVTLHTETRPRTGDGKELRSPTRPGQKAVVIDIREAADGFHVDLELSGGLGKQKPPAPDGAIPDLGEEILYTVLGGHFTSAAVPDDNEVPWTHGGAHEDYQPTDDDAQEAWE